uniref:TRC8-like N-terminal domain-containing protein n=1 Tax=Hucho hucho TaxID=62062 RepID=A0A4W5JND3_9TELE
ERERESDRERESTPVVLLCEYHYQCCCLCPPPGHVVNVVVLVLPVRHIIKLYLHILITLLFYVGHQISKDYVHGEVQCGYDGALYLDSLAFNRFVTSLTSESHTLTLWPSTALSLR